LVASERSDSGKRYGVGIYFFEQAGETAEAAETQKPPERGSRGAVQEIDVLAGLGNQK
jgi:membrane-bound inhibitor of C-type lysozyme